MTEYFVLVSKMEPSQIQHLDSATIFDLSYLQKRGVGVMANKNRELCFKREMEKMLGSSSTFEFES